MAEEQGATGACLQEDQSGRPTSRSIPQQEEADLFVPLSEEAAAQALSSTDSTILPPEPRATRGAGMRAVQLEPPSITKVFQGRAATAKARNDSDIRVIVLHTPEGGVQATLGVLEGTRASFDFYLPLSGELYRCNDYRRHVAWHAGDWPYNARSVGIEQGDFAAKSGRFPDDHYRRLAYLVAYLIQTTATPLRYAKQYGEDGLIDHSTITPDRRFDPGPHFKRQQLLELVEAYLTGAEPSPWRSSSAAESGMTWTRGQLTAVQGAVARREHKRDNNVMRQLEAGKSYSTDGYTDSGETVAGSSRWYHLSAAAGHGWVHSSGGTYNEG